MKTPSLLRGALSFSGMTMVARVLGLVRDMAINHSFGANAATDAFWAEVRAEPPQTLHVQVVTEPAANPAIGFVERIEPAMFLEITGSAELPLGAQSAAAALDGTFSFCPAEVAVSYLTHIAVLFRQRRAGQPITALPGRVNEVSRRT